MFSFEIIGINDEKWEELVKSSFIYDFHHTRFYHQIDNKFESVLLIAADENDFVSLPLVIRPIAGTNWYDATSVYGYAGPLSNQQDFRVSHYLIEYFKEEFKKYCKNNDIVTAFSRLHPLINQEIFFSNFGEVVDVNRTVSIDLCLSPEEQRRQYRKSNKYEINKLRRNGFVVDVAKGKSEIDRFIEIYFETMDRVEASSYYYFSKDYFYNFLSNSHFGSKLLVAKHEGKVVAGAIFTITNKIMQYHLAGTTEDYIRQTPMKLILDEARLLGNELNLEYLHLGGGVGGSDEDSLFRFKSGFSKSFMQFSVWKYIANSERYSLLVRKMKTDKKSGFFPLYRNE